MKNKLQKIIKHIKTMFYNLSLCVSLKKDSTNVEERNRLKRIRKIGKFRIKIESQRLFEKELKEECDKMNKEIGIPNFYRFNDITVIQKVGYIDFINASEELLRGSR